MSRHHETPAEMRAQAAGYEWRIANLEGNPLDWQPFFDACLRGTENEHDHPDEAAVGMIRAAWVLEVGSATYLTTPTTLTRSGAFWCTMQREHERQEVTS